VYAYNYSTGALVSTSATQTGTSYTVPNLTASTSYTLKVAAIDNAGNLSSQVIASPNPKSTAAAPAGDCSSALWSSGTSYALNQVATVNCVASPINGNQCYGFGGQKIAVKCTNTAWCSSVTPDGSGNDNGVWSKTATCP
jgi:chitodextrinase